MIVGISVAVIVFVFCLQRLGSSKIGFLYSPILITWFLVNGAVGIYNIAKWQPDVFKAVSPSYAVKYFQSGSRRAWLSLGGCVLCITGSEAMFADMGHFSHKSILVSCLAVAVAVSVPVAVCLRLLVQLLGMRSVTLTLQPNLITGGTTRAQISLEKGLFNLPLWDQSWSVD